jgi:hypothetical protein
LIPSPGEAFDVATSVVLHDSFGMSDPKRRVNPKRPEGRKTRRSDKSRRTDNDRSTQANGLRLTLVRSYVY